MGYSSAYVLSGTPVVAGVLSVLLCVFSCLGLVQVLQVDSPSRIAENTESVSQSSTFYRKDILSITILQPLVSIEPTTLGPLVLSFVRVELTHWPSLFQRVVLFPPQ